eukprot:9476485-Pyramimonas_sp.AAC.1
MLGNCLLPPARPALSWSTWTTRMRSGTPAPSRPPGSRRARPFHTGRLRRRLFGLDGKGS